MDIFFYYKNSKHLYQKLIETLDRIKVKLTICFKLYPTVKTPCLIPRCFITSCFIKHFFIIPFPQQIMYLYLYLYIYYRSIVVQEILNSQGNKQLLQLKYIFTFNILKELNKKEGLRFFYLIYTFISTVQISVKLI